jgi:hypothetical protein
LPLERRTEQVWDGSGERLSLYALLSLLNFITCAYISDLKNDKHLIKLPEIQ